MVGARFWKQSNSGVKFTLVAFLFLLTFMGTSYFFDRRLDVSAFMWLPKEARVIEYRNSVGGECFVRFSLPRSRNTESTFNEIWTKNASIKASHSDPYILQGNDRGFLYSMRRDEPSGIFEYEVQRWMPATMAPRGTGPYLAPAKKAAPSVKGP